MDPVTELKADVLIIGTEAAGAKAAIEAHARGASVLVVTKGAMGYSGSTVMAGAGVQAPLGHGDPRDNADVFFSDVVRGGAFLNNQKLLERLVNLASSEVLKVNQWGAAFARTRDGRFVQHQGPGSTYPRSLVVISGGVQWRRAFRAEFKRRGIAPMEDFFVTRLLMSRGQVAGAVGVSIADGRPMVLRSKTTILATGGCGQLFRRTDMPSGATGDGYALAYEAGAELMDMEFHQCFPYHCYGPPGREQISCASLRYALRGKLFNSHGEEFLEKYLPSSKAWGLRDPTSRAIYLENLAGRGSPRGGAYLSVSHLPLNMVENTVKGFNPRFLTKVKKAGIDLTKEAFEVGPAVHYTIGGIRVDVECDTNIPRLVAIGENAGGMDGAERIDAGPAICWCLTMGLIGGENAAARARDLDWLPVDTGQVEAEQRQIETLLSRRQGITGFDVKEKVKDVMWEKCGLVRNQAGLEEALKAILDVKQNDLPRLCVPGASRRFNVGLIDALEARNMVTVAELTIRAALIRRESRRSHYRTDFPAANNKEWLRNICVKKVNGEAVFSQVPVVAHRMQPPEEEGVEESRGN